MDDDKAACSTIITWNKHFRAEKAIRPEDEQDYKSFHLKKK